jgi:propanediol dehydratase small subunit
MSAASASVAAKDTPLAPVSPQHVQAQAVKAQKEQLLDNLANKVTAQIEKIFRDEIRTVANLPRNTYQQEGVVSFPLPNSNDVFGLRVAMLLKNYSSPTIQEDLQKIKNTVQGSCAQQVLERVAKILGKQGALNSLMFITCCEETVGPDEQSRLAIIESLCSNPANSRIVQTLVWRAIFPNK